MSVTLAAVFPKTEASLTFRSYSVLLRWIAKNYQQAGLKLSPATIYIGSLRGAGDPLGGALHHVNRMLTKWRMTNDQLRTLITVQARYRQYCHYLTEILPDWKDVDRIPYMDNSVEAVQVDRWGNTRTVMVVPPRGDTC